MPDKPKIWLSSPHMGGEEMHFVQQAFDTNWIAPLGPHVDAFEQALAGRCDSLHCAALSSGTAAIHLALILLNIKKGDYVICQSFTFSASANPITYVGARPVFVDSEKETWNMDPELLEKAILECMGEQVSGFRSQVSGAKSKEVSGPAAVSEVLEERGDDGATGRLTTNDNDTASMLEHASQSAHRTKKTKGRKPKAIIVVHLYGMPAKMEEIMAVARKYDIPVIEDAAEALGSRYDGKPAGSFGTMGILSFNGNKIITTSGGGALLSNDESLICRARFLATQARDQAPHYQHSHIGYNYRMSNVIAGIGLGQLKVLEQRVTQRRSNNSFYREQLSDFPGIIFQTEPSVKYFSNYWLTSIYLDPALTGGITREEIRYALLEENIESRPLWKPMHLQPVFRNARSFVNGTSEDLFNKGLCLPSGSNLKTDDLKRVCNIIISILTKRKSQSKSIKPPSKPNPTNHDHVTTQTQQHVSISEKNR